MDRRDELEQNLAAVERRIAAACDDAGRPRADVHLVVVTKTYPASDVELLAGLGVTDVGENRHPEARDKREQTVADLRWHFVGGLQSNKAAAVARYADVVHSIDRVKLVGALSRGAVESGREVVCLVQVDLDDPASHEGRSGATPADVPAVADAIASAEGLALGGVMAVAPLGADPAPAFARLAEVAERLRADHPDATAVSAGMSGDLEAAVHAGATHLRVGRSVLGERSTTH